MGIDVYLEWDGRTKEEEDAQITGFSIAAGGSGYLREAYHGGPYATRELVPESFDDACWASEPNGAYIVVEGPQYVGVDLDARPTIPFDVLRDRLPAALAATEERYADPETREMASQSLRDFVSLAERKLSEGRRVWVYTSY